MASAEGVGERPSVAAAVERALSVFPILVGVMGAPPPSPDDAEGASLPPLPPDRIVLLNPLTQSMVVLQGHAELIAELLSGSRRPPGPPPASKASIDSLKIVNQDAVSGMIDEDCPVCLDELRSSGEDEQEKVAVVKEMPCGHRFHGMCIEKWLRLHGSCPVCRFQMPAEDDGKGKNSGGGGDGETQGESGGDDGGERGRRGRRELWVTVAIGRREEEQEESQTEQQSGETREHGEA